MIPIQSIGFWPGLPRLWYRGDVAGLGWALIFGAAFNLALISTFYWPSWITPWGVRGLWLAIVALSFGFGCTSWINWGEIAGKAKLDEGTEELYLEAQDHYLRGEYFEAEAALHRIFSSGKQDVEAAILMVLILRRTRRWAQALYCIDRLLLLDNAMVWQRELGLERKSIQESMGKLQSDPHTTSPLLETTA